MRRRAAAARGGAVRPRQIKETHPESAGGAPEGRGSSRHERRGDNPFTDGPGERGEGLSGIDAAPAEPEALTRALTAREIQIARLVCRAKRNKEIARELCLSQQTVQTHLRNIYAKLNINSRVELVLLVLELGYRLMVGRR